MKRFILFVFISLLIPSIAYGHVKWFTDEEAVRAPIEQILSPEFIIVALLSAFLLATLPEVSPRMRQTKAFIKFEHIVKSLRPYTYAIIKYGTAIGIAIQIFTGGLFAPELLTPMGIWALLPWLAVVLLLIPTKFTDRTGAIIVLILFIVTTMEYGTFHMLDYAFYPAIIFMLIFHGTSFERFSFPLLYLATGLSLCWVATEKWVYPSMGQDVIVSHGVPTFGFDPVTFLMLAGFIEFIVGYLLVVGILNRVLALVLTMIFISTTFLFGITEIIGHFIIHAILLTFIIEGTSFYKPPVAWHDTRIEKIIFIGLNFIFTLSLIVLIYYRFA
ncbi:DoxX family membrane protein [Paenalkalicoccus suaedae]|uniref:DoxX family membrane protein n=1 Tax=Paenalkalicoccus suaedae TaxID=2592382 RepID=A0A859FCL8_9BACI|nr:DoxX family membrane protein [Paenalkalicoccus suaedae]QKS70531.1 DoxX family membrane protein [Paenalkalicoccus suaedae]